MFKAINLVSFVEVYIEFAYRKEQQLLFCSGEAREGVQVSLEFDRQKS